MDKRLRELERQVQCGDPDALRRYNTHLCRLRGHQFTGYRVFNEYAGEDFIKVRICHRCLCPDVVDGRELLPIEIPEIVIYRNVALSGCPQHALIKLETKKVKVRKARKKGEPPTPIVHHVKITNLKTACGQNLKPSFDNMDILPQQGKPITCKRCLKNKNRMQQAREAAATIYPVLYNLTRDQLDNSSTHYLREYPCAAKTV